MTDILKAENSMNLPVYDVVLLPPESIDDLSISLSKQLAEVAATEFTLAKNQLYPHISLYMLNLTPENLEVAQRGLERIATATPTLPLTGEKYATSPEGMCEIFYQKTPELVQLQQEIIEVLNPLRSGLREVDPVGRQLSNYINSAPEEARQNLQQYGYDEIGNFFKPHITVARFVQRDFSPERADFVFPPATEFSETFSTLALCEMGPNGTCTRVVAKWPLRRP